MRPAIRTLTTWGTLPLALLVSCGGGAETGNTDGTGTNGSGGPTNGSGAVGDLGSLGGGIIDLSNPGDGTPTAGCIQLAVAFEELTPTVVVLVDRSGSMNENFANSDRWNTLRDTLIDPVGGVIARFQPDVRFGLSMYTSLGGNAGGQCPILVDVDIALDNFDTIQQVYASTELLNATSDTPTSESIRAVTERLLAFQEVGPKAIILATDGNPDTCEDADDHSIASQRLSEAAVEDAFARGIETFVVSVGDEVTQAHLQNLANLGVGSPRNANEPFYQATDAGALVNAFSTIVSAVVPCEFELNGTVTPADAPRGTVSIDGTPAAFGQGWDLPSESTVRLLGDTCQTFQQGGSQLDISFPCGTFAVR